MSINIWTEAKGSCGLNAGDEKVYGAYVNNVALFAFKSPLSGDAPFYTCVVAGEMSVGGNSLGEAQEKGLRVALDSRKEDRGRHISKREFDWLMNNPSRLPYAFGTFLKNGGQTKPSHKASLDRAKELTAQIDKLHQEIDDLLGPIVCEAMASGVEACKELLGELPEGLHRTEVKVFISESQKRTSKTK